MPPAKHFALIALWMIPLVVSGYQPHDTLTWFLEVFPAILGIAILAATYKKFRLTDIVYGLIFVHSLILMLGGHYTYAEVPLGYWMQDWFGFTRNHYDRIGHFAQGFVPAIIARELLLRHGVMRRGPWLAAIVILSCLGISAIYELIEWWAAVLGGSAADAFLGTQGDVWDTQKDMFMAGIGASTVLLLLSGLHDAQMHRLPKTARSTDPRL